MLVILVLSTFAQQTFANKPEVSIVGRRQAEPGEFPYQCSLQQANGEHICSCSIIDDSRVLTAAHCLRGVVPPPFHTAKIVIGSVSNREGGTTHLVKYGKVHPNFEEGPQQWLNDIAVVLLRKPIEFNAYQSPIPLATEIPVPGTVCVLTGWGQTSTNGSSTEMLLKMESKIVSRNYCNLKHVRAIFENHLCALDESGTGACNNDGGSPLVCNGKLAGILSWFTPCTTSVPDVFSSVAHQHQFINSVRDE